MDVCLIGIDVGTTSTKATLIDANGNERASFSRPHPMDRSSPGMAEQNPGIWLDSVLAALTHFTQVADISTLAGIGLTSQVNTHVFVDKDGNPLRPAITWQDTRPAEDADRFDRQITTEQRTAWFGGPVPIDASHALARMGFVARTQAEIWQKTHKVLLPKDFIALQLTGQLATDPISSVGLIDQSGNYVRDLLALLPHAQDRLPPLVPIQQNIGTIKAGLPCAGVPVIIGVMDAWAGMFGCGVVADGDVMYQSGTSDVPGVVSSKVVPTEGVILFPPYDGIRFHAAPIQSGGASLNWLSQLLGQSIEDLLALASQVRPNQSSPYFLPHLAGERAPIWDASSRGVFAGLTASTGPAEMAYAVLEGVAHAGRWAFEALERSSDQRLSKISIGGGGTQSDLWCQIRADVLGCRLDRVAVSSTAALGAAMLAGAGLAVFPSIPVAVKTLVRFDRRFEPDRDNSSLFASRQKTYRHLYQALSALRTSGEII